MFHSRVYRLFISVILVALLLPASFVQADSRPSASPQTDIPPEDIQASCPPYNESRPGNAEYVQHLPPECMKMYLEDLRLQGQQTAPQAEPLTAGGPDDFGYTFANTGYSWIDGTTDTGLNSDDRASDAFNIGFNFPFYGFKYSQLYFSTNGLITFGKPYPWGDSAYNIPDPFAPNDYIAPFWDDLVVGANYGNPAGHIYSRLLGTAPNRSLVLEWRNVDEYGLESSQDFSFETILYENGNILFQYKSLPVNYWSSAGIEDNLGADGLQSKQVNTGVSPLSAVLFTYPTTPMARVFLSPLEQGGFTVPGTARSYTVKVANIGTMGTDTYDLVLPSSWAADSYASDGVTPLTDTDSDGTVDTGPIVQAGSINIVVKVSAPGSAQVGDNNLTALAAASSLDDSESKQVNIYTSIPASFANAFVDADNNAMSFATASRYQSNTYKLTTDNYNGYDVATIRLLNGNHLYAWDRERLGQNTYVDEIEYMIVGSSGSAVRGMTRLASHYSASMYTGDWDPSLAQAPNGTIGIAWRRYVYDYNNDTWSYNIYFATLDSAGNLLTGPTNITNLGMSDIAPRLANATIAATDDNRFILGWEYYSGGNYNLYIAGRNTSGANVFSPKAFTSNNQSWDPFLNNLTGGRAILTWLQNNGGPYYAVINSNGSIYKADTDLGSPWMYWSPDAVMMPNGKTAIAWGTTSGVSYSILNSAYDIESGPHHGFYSSLGYDLSVTTDAASHVIMSWMDGSTHQSLVYALGDSAGNYLTTPMPYKSSSTFFNTSWNGQGIAPFGNKVDINIGPSLMGRYEIPPRNSLVQSYAATVNGPVKVKSPEGKKFFTSERVIAGTSFNEVMGFPNNQLTTDYWFPWYDNVSMNTWILVGNPATSAATVEIWIGGVKRTTQSIPAGGSITPRFNIPAAGPVRVRSTNGVPIFTSERTQYGPNNAFNEVMGYPANQFTTDYWFPWYDNVSMGTWLLVGNPSTTQAANVDIYIGGVKRITQSIPAGGSITPRFNLQAGPVRVVSTNGVKIFSSERTVTLAGDGFNEVMGYPGNQLTTEYWYPWYDNVSMTTWILVGNPSTTTAAAVEIWIGAAKVGTYSIPAKGAITPRFNRNAGPVRVVVTNGVNVFTSQRVLYGPNNSFNEVMGYPSNKLDTLYWFPWYDSASMSTNIVVGMP